MVAWFIPALKAILPHLGIILSAAVPVFTKKNADAVANQALVQQQIAELQAAASQNASYIKELAAQLQTAVAALEQTATLTEARNRRARWLASMAILMVVLAWSAAILWLFLLP